MNWLLDWLNWGPDTSNFMSTVIGVIIGIAISWWIYVLQEKDARRQEKNLSRLNDLATKIDAYIEQQQDLATAIRMSALQIILSHLHSVEQLVGRYLTVAEKNREALDARGLESFKAMVEKSGYFFHANSQAIVQQAEFLRPYIAPELYRHLGDLARSVSEMTDHMDGHTQAEKYLDAWMRQSHSLIERIEATKSQIQQILERPKHGSGDLITSHW